MLLGIDISGTSTGYCVAEFNAKTKDFHIWTIGHIKTTARDSDGVRMQKIRDRISVLFDMYKIDTVIKESGFVKGGRSTQLIFKAVGVAELTCADRGKPVIYEYAPTTIKKWVGGHGKASKDDVAAGVIKFTGFKDFKTDDESDAAAIILTHLSKEGLLTL